MILFNFNIIEQVPRNKKLNSKILKLKIYLDDNTVK